MPGDLVLIGHLQDVPLILMIDAMSVVKRDIMLMTVIAIAVEEEAGHGLDHIPLPGVGEGGQDQHLLEDQGLCLFVDQDQLHSEDLGLVL
ncbi:hypothetical protein LEMLEM_LOCUS9108 [Lemmus lemmus]